jgi:hypothetical protein
MTTTRTDRLVGATTVGRTDRISGTLTPNRTDRVGGLLRLSGDVGGGFLLLSGDMQTSGDDRVKLSGRFYPVNTVQTDRL